MDMDDDKPLTVETGAGREKGGGGNLYLIPGDEPLGVPLGLMRLRASRGDDLGADGSIIFETPKRQEMIRLDGDGCIYIRGNKTDDDREVYDLFRAWMKHAVHNTKTPLPERTD